MGSRGASANKTQIKVLLADYERLGKELEKPGAYSPRYNTVWDNYITVKNKLEKLGVATGNNAKPSKREPKALEVNAIEKWNVKGKWTDYKKTLQTKFAKKYPTYEIKIKQSTGRGSSGAGLIDYIVYGVEK